MPQDTAEHDAKDMANMPTRPGKGNGAQEERPEMPETAIVQDVQQIELQKRNLALEEQLLEMQKRNLVLEEQLLEWQRRILAQDERLLEMQKRMEIFEKRKGADTKMEEGKATVPDIKDKANANQTTKQTSINTLTLSTTTLSMDNKLSRESDPRIDRHVSTTYEYTRQLKFAAFVLSLCLFLLMFIDTQDHTMSGKTFPSCTQCSHILGQLEPLPYFSRTNRNTRSNLIPKSIHHFSSLRFLSLALFSSSNCLAERHHYHCHCHYRTKAFLQWDLRPQGGALAGQQVYARI